LAFASAVLTPAFCMALTPKKTMTLAAMKGQSGLTMGVG
jgi:hypothetical protein